jgi:threonine/homoserine/homoserine lactone efflux protein
LELNDWLSLFSICLLGAMSPGPSLAVVFNNTLRNGHRAGYACAISHGAAIALYGLLTVTGLALVINRYPGLFLAVQVAGGAYLLYLGIRSLRATSAGPTGDSAPGRHAAAAQGFLTALLNPKIAVFMLALFSQFLEPGSAQAHKAIMVATVGGTDAAWYCCIVAMVSRPAVLAGLQRHGQTIERIFGVVLIALSVTMLLRSFDLV